MSYFVYILASKPQGMLYIGMTSDLLRRGHEHRVAVVDGFTKKYRVKRLVWFEEFSDVRLALQREKTMKHWNRAWKISLIESANPDWRDLFDDLCR